MKYAEIIIRLLKVGFVKCAIYNMEKDKKVKIVSFQANTYVNSDGETFTKIFGLGDNEIIYEWSFERQGWES